MGSIWTSLGSAGLIPRQPAGLRTIRRCCCSFTFTVISIGFSRAAGLSVRLGATLRSCGSPVGLFPITRRLPISARITRAVRHTLPRDRPADESERRHRRQQVQSGQQPRQEFHAREDGGPPRSNRGKRGRRYEPAEALAAKTAHLKEKLAKLATEIQRLKAIEKEMLASPDPQISMTDPDSRSMATSGRGSGGVGYNVQVAVDTEHHLIVTHEVTNTGSDRSQLANVASQAKDVLGADHLDVVADRGYFNSTEILACEQADITVTLPKPMTSGAKSDGRFGKQDFVYLPTEDVYRCPAGEKLTYRYTNEEDGKTLRRYWTTACPRCPLKSQCTKGAERRITRWEHEHVLEAVQQRLDEKPQAMRQRRETVEHPFGTLKMRMGATHFLMKRLPKVATEMAMHVLAYNLTRVMNIIGVQPLLAAMRA